MFAQALRDQGLEPWTELLVVPQVTGLPPDIAQIFGKPSGTWAIYRMRRQGSGQIPYRLNKMWYLHPQTEQFLQEIRDKPEMNVLDTVRKALGKSDQSISERLLSRLPTTDEASLLSITKSTPILEMRRTNATGGEILLIQQNIFVASLVELEYSFTR